MSDFQIRLFAAAKQALQKDAITLRLEPPHTLQRLQSQLALDYPLIAALVQKSRLAVNATYASPDQLVIPTDEIALIPPVSGG